MAESDPRDILLNFVETGNVRDAEFTPIPQERALVLRERLEAIRSDGVIDATGDPGDFAAALRDREAEIEREKNISRGKDVPRLNEDKPGFKQFYKAHDFIATAPAPGGLGTILIIILIFWLMILPATTKGETRALLLWDVILGRKQFLQEGEDQRRAIVPGDGGESRNGFNPGNQDTSGGFNQPPVLNGIPPAPSNVTQFRDWLSEEPDTGRLINTGAGARGGLGV